MDAGMAPARGLVSFCVCLDIHRSEANQQTYPIGHSCRENELSEVRQPTELGRDHA